MKKVLIMGGSGFIGSHVVDKAISQGLIPIIFDRHIKHSYPFEIDNKCEFFLGDVENAGAVIEAVQKADYVINLAGILGTQETINKPIPSIQTNIIGCINFLEACRLTKFHQVKAAQIGVGNYWMNNSYSISKSTGVRFCMMYNKEHGTKVAMVRGLNAYGPRQKHLPVRKIIPTFIVKALSGEDIEIYGDGEQIMDMIWVRDLAKILIDTCIKDHGVYDKTFEAGTGRKTTVNWIAKQVIKAAQSKSKIVHLPMRPGEPEKSVVLGDPQTLKPLLEGGEEYNFTPFEQGIKKTVDWYKNNYNWKED